MSTTNVTAHTEQERKVLRIIQGVPTEDGAGVKLTRVIGSQQLSEIDPFLLLDEFRSDDPAAYIAGFPPHPHRGFETVTYMLAGRMRHEDNKGHAGSIETGGVQWMTAGRGIVHSEMPEQDRGLMWGFQLWVNLPARDKMKAPAYQEHAAAEIPVLEPAPGVSTRIVAGRIDGIEGPVQGIAVAPLYVDIRLEPGGEWRAPLAEGHAGFAYVYDGEARVADRAVRRGTLAQLSDGELVHLAAATKQPTGLLLVAGLPLNEPVARYGPFVMNSHEEIREAFRDYETGRL